MRAAKSKVFSRKFSGHCLTLTIAFTLAGCSSSNNSSTPPPPPVVSVTLNQSTASVAVSTKMPFTATVTGTTNTAVTWSVDSVSGGNSTVGTISTAGVYTAPSLVGTHTVTATSVADTSKTASAAVTVTGVVSVSPASVDVVATQTQQFSATVQGFSSSTVTWVVDQISGGNSTVGTIISSGLYTSPATPGSHTITATSTASSSVSGSAQAAVFTLSLSPSAPTITTSSTEQFTATTQGLSSPVLNWTVDQLSGGNSTVGTITAAGLYTAPSTVGTHAIAVSVVSTSATAATSVAVFSLVISP